MPKRTLLFTVVIVTLLVFAGLLHRNTLFAQERYRIYLPLLRVSSSAIAFNGVRLADQYGERIHSLTEPLGFEGFNPSYSPDGTQLVFVGYPIAAPTGRNVYIVNTDGTGLKQVTTGSFLDSEPVWSPDGTRIAFHSNRNGVDNIYTVRPDGTGLLQMTEDTVKAQGPSWSPDGERIAFTRYLSEFARQIVIMRKDGTEQTTLRVPEQWNCGEPDWSPTGIQLAYVCVTELGVQYLFVGASDGTDRTPVVVDADVTAFRRVGILDPDWSPDGTRLLYVTRILTKADLNIVNVDGTGQRVLIEDGGNGSWQPVPDTQP